MATTDNMSIYDVLSPQQKSGIQRKINNTRNKIKAIQAKPESGGTLTPSEKSEIRELKKLISSYQDSLDYDKTNAERKKATEKSKKLESQNREIERKIASKEKSVSEKIIKSGKDKANQSTFKKELRQYRNSKSADNRRKEIRKAKKLASDKPKQAEIDQIGKAYDDNAVKKQAARKSKDATDSDLKQSKAEAVKRKKAGYGANKTKASDYTVDDYDTLRGKAKVKRSEFMEKNTPKKKVKNFKFPTKRVAASGLGALAGLTASTAADRYEDSDARGFEKIEDDLTAKGLDLISPLGGWGAAGTGALVANEAAINKLRSMYDPYGSENLSRSDLYKRYMRDVGGASKDAVRKKINKANQAKYNVSQKLGSTTDMDRKMDLVDESHQLSENKKDRWTNRPVIEAEEEKIKQIERDRLDRELDSRSKSQKMADADINIGPRDTATHNAIRNNINKRIDDISASLNSDPMASSSNSELRKTYMSSIDDLNNLKTKLDTIPEYELSKLETSSEFKDFEATDAQKPFEEVKKQAKKGKRKAKKGAVDLGDTVTAKASDFVDKAKNTGEDLLDTGKQAYADAKNTGEDLLDTGKEKNKGWYKKAKEMPGNMYDRVFGKSEVPTASASGQSTTAGAPDTKQGKIRKTAKLGGKLGTAATLPQIGEAAWGLADIGHGLYDAPDKGQFVQETGESMYEGLKNLPEELMTTAQDYKTMYDQGEYLPMVGKAAQDYLVPSVKSLGNIAMGLGEQAGLYEAPDYWDLDAKDFSTLSERGPNYTPPVDFHPSQMSPGTKQLMTPEPKIKESGVIPPAAENVPELDKRAIAEKYMTNRKVAMDKMQMAHNQAKYGGYQNQDDYAQSFGVKVLPNTLNRYGNTPVYEGVDEFGNRSFSDSPGQVADPSKYDQVARNAADTARAQYLQFKKDAEAKAKQDAIHPALRGLSEEQRYALGPREQAKAILDNNKIQANKGKEKDLYDRNLAANLGDASDQAHIRQGHTNNLTQRLISGQATPDEVNRAKLMVREGVLDTGVKLPFFSTPTKYQLKLNTDSNDPNYVDVAGKWFESMPKEYEDLNIATTMYDKKPKY